MSVHMYKSELGGVKINAHISVGRNEKSARVCRSVDLSVRKNKSV